MTIQVKRKYTYITEYEIQGLYSGEWECENTETTLKEAMTSLQEYRENVPNIPHRIKWITTKTTKKAWYTKNKKTLQETPYEMMTPEFQELIRSHYV